MRQELHDHPSPEYNNVITEMGICHSTSELWAIQKPYREYTTNLSNPDNMLYTSVDIMRLTIIPHFLDTGNVTIVGMEMSRRIIRNNISISKVHT